MNGAVGYSARVPLLAMEVLWQRAERKSSITRGRFESVKEKVMQRRLVTPTVAQVSNSHWFLYSTIQYDGGSLNRPPLLIIKPCLLQSLVGNKTYLCLRWIIEFGWILLLFQKRERNERKREKKIGLDTIVSIDGRSPSHHPKKPSKFESNESNPSLPNNTRSDPGWQCWST